MTLTSCLRTTPVRSWVSRSRPLRPSGRTTSVRSGFCRVGLAPGSALDSCCTAALTRTASATSLPACRSLPCGQRRRAVILLLSNKRGARLRTGPGARSGMSDSERAGDGERAGDSERAGAAFSLDLSDDVREMRDWVHEFALNVMRPAASEWDEREETPWPILEEAAKIGLYSLEFFGQQWLEPTGLGTPVAFEELFWGDAGIGLALTGSCLAAVAVSSNGTQEQIGEWLPQMFGGPGDIKLGAFCSSEPDAGSDVGAIRTRAVYAEATDEWVLNGTKAWATNGGIADVHVVVATVDPGLGSRGQASFIVPPGTKGLAQGQKFRKHGVRASHTAEVILDDVRVPGHCLVGGKDRLDARLARLAAGGAAGEQAAMKTFEASRPSVAAMAVGGDLKR